MDTDLKTNLTITLISIEEVREECQFQIIGNLQLICGQYTRIEILKNTFVSREQKACVGS